MGRNMGFSFTVPKKTVFGIDAIETVKDDIIRFGKKAFVVTGPIVEKTGLAKKVIDNLSKWGIESTLYAGIIGEPTDIAISEGVNAYRLNKCDFFIGVGGGSPLDAVKAINAMNKLPGAVADYVGKEIIGDFDPMVLIPTTAGTGSESTKYTVITDTKRNIKMLLKGEKLLPDLAIIDPTFSLSAPAKVTAATGMDALTHAVEAYTSRKANVMTDIFAISAIKKIFKYLPKVYSNGKDLEAREQLAIAAYEAGICINNSSVTIVHGMSRPIGALFHVPHGISNAMLIKECLSYVKDGVPDKFAQIAKEIGVSNESATNEEATIAFINALESLCVVLEIPSLKEYGIDKNKYDAFIDKMAQDAIDSKSPDNTMKEITKEDIIKIYKKLW